LVKFFGFLGLSLPAPKSHNYFLIYLLAATTDAIYLQLMILHLKVILLCYFSLNYFDLMVLELFDSSTFNADQVIVVSMIIGVLVPGYSSLELALIGNAAFRKQLHGPIDRSITDLRILFLDQTIELLYADMFLHGKKGIKNLVSLSGILELVV
jgi:hypothetical protein